MANATDNQMPVETNVRGVGSAEANDKPTVRKFSKADYVRRELARRELARRSYRRYLYYVHGANWKKTRMSDFLADKIQEFVETDTGNAYDILVLQTPPQHGKSMTITESFPSWYLGRYPKNRVIIGSYNADTAENFGRKNKDKIEQFGKELFQIERGSVWNTTAMELSNGWGRMISRGIKGGITGNPANLILLDDPIKNREEADSETYRNALWNEWVNSIKTRLAARAKIIVIATPWHEDDLMNSIIASEQNVTVIRLPVEAEENDPLGRKPGDALCPELGKDNKWLAQFKAGYMNDPKKGGRRAWQALYQCSPRTEGGNMVHRDWWRYYNPKEITEFGTTIISVDAAFKNGEQNDYVAVEVWSKTRAYYYLRYCINEHLSFKETVTTIAKTRQLFPETRYIVIEDKANGSAVIEVLQETFVGVIPVTPKGGKEARVNAISAAIESGNVFLPDDRDWVDEFVDQFTNFPAVKHDDMVDAASQALTFLIWSTGYVKPEISQEQIAIEEAERQEQADFTGDGIYDVYDMSY